MGDDREMDPFVLDETGCDVDTFDDDERADVDPFLLDATDGGVHDFDAADDDVDETQPIATPALPTTTRRPPPPSTSLAEPVGEFVGSLIGAALAIGFMLAILYFLVRFVKWAWTE